MILQLGKKILCTLMVQNPVRLWYNSTRKEDSHEFTIISHSEKL